MAQYEHLPIYRKAFDLSVYLENIARNFSRYHKYTLGSDLRNLSRKIVRLIICANSERDKIATLEKIRVTVEELKVTARIRKEVKAFKNFNSFQYMMRESISIGKQCEGWIRSIRGR
jgi:hypothetical protein